LLVPGRCLQNSRNTNAVCNIFAPEPGFAAGPQLDDNYSRLCARTRRIISDPDIAISRPVWTLTIRQNGKPNPTVSTEPGLDIFRHKPNGTWRIFRFMACTAPADTQHP
jgi:hypothetical protein